MTTEQWVMQLLLGGMMGVIGQGIRAIVGFKKVYDQALAEKTDFPSKFQTSVFFVSLFTGFVAGTLASIAISDDAGHVTFDKNMLLGLAAAGYGGADFVEGFAKKYLPQT